jgi:transcriptional regulator with XRE-family HTH domain
MTAADLVDAARAGAGLPSFYRLARVLGVGDATVANWRHGRATPDDATTLRLAAMAGVDPAQALAAIHVQRCTDPAIRSVLATIAARVQQAGAAALAVILSVLISGSPDAQARARVGVLDTGAIPAPVVTIYTLARILGAWAAAMGVMRRLAVPIGAPCSI